VAFVTFYYGKVKSNYCRLNSTPHQVKYRLAADTGNILSGISQLVNPYAILYHLRTCRPPADTIFGRLSDNSPTLGKGPSIRQL
jgi:hypothetical protein